MGPTLHGGIIFKINQKQFFFGGEREGKGGGRGARGKLTYQINVMRIKMKLKSEKRNAPCGRNNRRGGEGRGGKGGEQKRGENRGGNVKRQYVFKNGWVSVFSPLFFSSFPYTHP